MACIYATAPGVRTSSGNVLRIKMACIYATAPGVGTSSGIRRVTPTGCAIPDDTSIDQAWTRDVDLLDIGQI